MKQGAGICELKTGPLYIVLEGNGRIQEICPQTAAGRRRVCGVVKYCYSIS